MLKNIEALRTKVKKEYQMGYDHIKIERDLKR